MAITDFEGIGHTFEAFFKDLFASTNPDPPPELDDLFPTPLTAQDTQGLANIPSGEEVRNAVFSMSNGKSPGPDGMSPLFFKF